MFDDIFMWSETYRCLNQFIGIWGCPDSERRWSIRVAADNWDRGLPNGLRALDKLRLVKNRWWLEKGCWSHCYFFAIKNLWPLTQIAAAAIQAWQMTILSPLNLCVSLPHGFSSRHCIYNSVLYYHRFRDVSFEAVMPQPIIWWHVDKMICLLGRL